METMEIGGKEGGGGGPVIVTIVTSEDKVEIGEGNEIDWLLQHRIGSVRKKYLKKILIVYLVY